MDNAIVTTQSRLPMGAPWGDQGTLLQNAPTSSEAIQQAGLDWPVQLRPAGFRNKKSTFVAMPTDMKVVVRTDTEKPLSIVGKKWKPIQNTDAFKFFDRFVEQGMCEYNTAGYVNGGEKVFIIAKIKADPLEVLPNDTVDSYFVLTNTHSAKASARVLFTNIRFACTNVLPAMMRSNKQSRILHMGDVSGTIQEVQELVDMRQHDFNSTLEQYRMLASKTPSSATVEHYLDNVLSSRVVKLNKTSGEIHDDQREDTHKNTKNRIAELIETGRGSDIHGVRGTWWGVSNATIEYFNHVQGRTTDTRIDSTFYGKGREKSARALTLALEMAA